MLNKKEAAEYLGVSTRALEYHIKQNNIGVQYARGKTGDVAMFDEKELRRLKAKIDERRAPRPAVEQEGSESPETEPRSLMRLSDASPLIEILSRLIQGARALPPSTPAVADKLMLSLPEASALSGISVEKLRAAVQAGKLKTVKGIGRGLGKVKRSDLELYVKKL
jgi:hypothetical protein